MLHHPPKCALIPAGGRGARLDRPGTPKPLVDIGGEPMLVRLLRQLSQVGIERAVVVVGYEGAHVARAILGRPLGLVVDIVENSRWERGLATSISCGFQRISETFVLAMADHVFDDTLIHLVANSPVNENEVLALVDRRQSANDAPDAVRVRLVGEQITDIGRSLSHFDAVDTGLFLATPSLFEAIHAVLANEQTELADALRLLAVQGRLRCLFAETGGWSDVDLPVDVVRTELRLRAQRRRASLRSVAVVPLLEPSAVLDFSAGIAARTKVVVGRSLLRTPENLGIVPPQSTSSPTFIFTDETVNRLYGEGFVRRLRSTGVDAHAIVLPDGEEAKTLSNYAYLVERVLSRGVDERSVFVSLGGGVVCNVCGFVASTIHRGLDLVHLPTTVMAQCDAAISHKQAINGTRGKNLIGSYYAPRLVAADIAVLRSLTHRQVRDGLAEVAKHALAQDRSYVELLLDYDGDLGDPDFLEVVVRRNVALKQELLARDPQEESEAVILQYGHTVGHPVEHLSGYRLSHGEAVAIGMMVAVRVAHLAGACSRDLVDVHERLLRHLDLPTEAPASIRTEDVLDALHFDKRYLTEGSRMVLLSDVGAPWRVEGHSWIPVATSLLADAFEATRGKDGFWLNPSPSSPARRSA